MATITDSWEVINAKCTSGEYKTAYALGDLVPITLNWGSSSENIDMELIGIDHDDLGDGTGKACLTFFSKQLLKDYRYGAISSGNGGWPSDRSLRSWCNNDLFNALPSDLQTVVKPVKKLSDNGYGSTELIETIDSVWFGSMEEVGYVVESVVTLLGQGTRYAYTLSPGEQTTDEWRTKAKADGTVHHWWLRSAITNDASKWSFMGTWGGPSWDNYFNNFGVAFGLCVGAVSTETEEPEVPEEDEEIVSAYYKISRELLVRLAKAVRNKANISDKLTPPEAIAEIYKLPAWSFGIPRVKYVDGGSVIVFVEPDSAAITETFSGFSTRGKASIGELQQEITGTLVVLQQTISSNDLTKWDYSSDRYVKEGTEGIQLVTSWDYISEEQEIDSGRMVVVKAITNDLSSVEGVEING